MKASVFVPGHISGFFQPCEASTPERTGSRNCGPCIDLGVLTEVEAKPSNRNDVRISIDGKPAFEAITTSTAIKQLLKMIDGSFKINVNHRCQVPIGAGYGASGAGTLGAVLALQKVLELNLAKQKLVEVAHVAEVKSYTGLGDVGAQAFGGLVIGLEPGAPPHGRWSRIVVPSGVKVMCATLGPISTKEFLRDANFRRRAGELGAAALKDLLRQPNIARAISCSRDFAEKLGLFDDELRELAEAAERSGAIGASQAMLGRAMFAFVPDKKFEEVKGALLELLQPKNIMEAGIYEKYPKVGGPRSNSRSRA